MTTRKSTAVNNTKTAAARTPGAAKSRPAAAKTGSVAAKNGSAARQSRPAAAKSIPAAGAGKKSQAVIASLEAQIASLEKQIALLQDQSSKSQVQSKVQSSKSKVQRGESKVQTSKHSELRSCAGGTDTLNSALPKAGSLPAPVLRVTVLGGDGMRVDWDPIGHAGGYMIEWADDPLFSLKGGVFVVDAAVAFITFRGLLPDTNHYIRAKAVGQGDWSTSDYSAVATFKTGSAPESDTAGQLQGWMDELQTVTQNATALLPQLETTELDTADRMRLNGSGVRRYGFIDKVSDVAEEFPQFWPAFGAGAVELKTMLREIEVLRNLLVWSRWCSRVVQDLLLITGDEAFRIANSYYTTAREGARRKNPEAVQVFELLNLFWSRPRRKSEEPAMPEIERGVRSLLHGTKDGKVAVENESDRIVKGKKTIIVDIKPKRRRTGVTATRGKGSIVERDEIH